MNPSGNALVIWRQESGTFDVDLVETIWSSHSATGSEWTTPESIQSEVGEQGGNPFRNQFSYPHVAVDPQGNGIAAWSQSNDESWTVWTSRFDASGGWEGAELLSTSPLDATHASLAMDADGNAIAIWVQSAYVDCSIWSRRYTLDTGWGAPEPIAATAAWSNCDYAKVAVGAAGDAVAVWRVRFGSYWSNRYTPGQGWSEPEAFDIDMEVVDFAVDGDGTAMVALRRYYEAEDKINLWVSISTRPQ